MTVRSDLLPAVHFSFAEVHRPSSQITLRSLEADRSVRAELRTLDDEAVYANSPVCSASSITATAPQIPTTVLGFRSKPVSESKYCTNPPCPEGSVDCSCLAIIQLTGRDFKKESAKRTQLHGIPQTLSLCGKVEHSAVKRKGNVLIKSRKYERENMCYP